MAKTAIRILAVCTWVATGCGGNPLEPGHSGSDWEGMALTAVETQLPERLPGYGPYDFGLFDVNVEYLGGNAYRVRGSVDIPRDFGRTVKNLYVAEVAYEGPMRGKAATEEGLYNPYNWVIRDLHYAPESAVLKATATAGSQ